MVLNDKYIIANNWHIHRLSNISCLRCLSSFILLYVLWILRCGLLVLVRLSLIKLIFDIWSSRGKNCKYALNAVNWLCIYFYYVSREIFFYIYILNKIALFGLFWCKYSHQRFVFIVFVVLLSWKTFVLFWIQGCVYILLKNELIIVYCEPNNVLNIQN